MTDTQATTLRLPLNLYEDLRRESFETKDSMNAIIVSALRLRKTTRLNATERKVWAIWNSLSEGDPAPVKRIARALGMTPADVAFIVYPAEQSGRWDDSQEPDL